MPFGISPTELIIFLVIVLLVFGAARIPEIGRSVGRGMREFKDAVTGRGDETPPSLPRAPEDEENVAAAPRERDTVS